MAEASKQLKTTRRRRKPLKVVFIAAEAYPYAEVGGLSRVVYFLPRALAKLGHDVRIFIPRYGKIDEEQYPMETIYKGLRVPTGGKPEYLICNVKSATPEPGLRFYFLENMEYYEKRANEYGYSDDPRRFALLVRGALEYFRHCDWCPQIIHANDWHTALAAQYLQTVYKKSEKLSDIATVYTIHNIHFQGLFDHRFVSQLDFDDGKSEIPGFFEDRLNTINMMRRGILYSDLITTVSPTYAREILTQEYGEGLDGLLGEVRTKLVGILNGIDYDEFNPATDNILVKNYDVTSLERRSANKLALQREFNLDENTSLPMISFTGRLDGQKGIDLLVETIETVLKEYPVQFVANGGGDNRYRQFLMNLAKKYPKRVGVNIYPDFSMPRHIYAGADMVLLPSAFEPCGIVQMEAMRYGAIPIVRKTGGLADTVENFDPKTNTGDGFVFTNYDKLSFYGAMVRALEAYQYPSIWRGLIERAMQKDLSWNNSARLYEELYRRALGLKVQKEASKALVEV